MRGGVQAEAAFPGPSTSVPAEGINAELLEPARQHLGVRGSFAEETSTTTSGSRWSPTGCITSRWPTSTMPCVPACRQTGSSACRRCAGRRGTTTLTLYQEALREPGVRAAVGRQGERGSFDAFGLCYYTWPGQPEHLAFLSPWSGSLTCPSSAATRCRRSTPTCSRTSAGTSPTSIQGRSCARPRPVRCTSSAGPCGENADPLRLLRPPRPGGPAGGEERRVHGEAHRAEPGRRGGHPLCFRRPGHAR